RGFPPGFHPRDTPRDMPRCPRRCSDSQLNQTRWFQSWSSPSSLVRMTRSVFFHALADEVDRLVHVHPTSIEGDTVLSLDHPFIAIRCIHVACITRPGMELPVTATRTKIEALLVERSFRLHRVIPTQIVEHNSQRRSPRLSCRPFALPDCPLFLEHRGQYSAQMIDKLFRVLDHFPLISPAVKLR